MKPIPIPIRHIRQPKNNPNLSSDFNIRNLKDVLNGKDMVQDLHRHDFYFFLALKKGQGDHEIDFTPYKITHNSVFFVRP